MKIADIESLKKNVRGLVETNAPMCQRSTFKVGGAADIFVSPIDVKDLKQILRFADDRKLPVSVVGGASNILVLDGGIRGIALHTGFFNNVVLMSRCRLHCGSGVALPCLAKMTANEGLAGFEGLAGIPGTIGGALRMNAGAHGAQMKDITLNVTLMNRRGHISTLRGAALSFEYRRFNIEPDAIIIGATLQLKKQAQAALKSKIRDNLETRRKTQPTGAATAGSVFKNPKDDFAGRLIEEAGLKGAQVGNAMVSTKHANFIENIGGATAADILALIIHIEKTVKKKFNIALEREIKVIGERQKEGDAARNESA